MVTPNTGQGAQNAATSSAAASGGGSYPGFGNRPVDAVRQLVTASTSRYAICAGRSRPDQFAA
jgi:hypothetical protein